MYGQRSVLSGGMTEVRVAPVRRWSVEGRCEHGYNLLRSADSVVEVADASRAFAGKPKTETHKATSSEVEQLKAELAALQAKVDRLSR